jgi:hypothetical protein
MVHPVLSVLDLELIVTTNLHSPVERRRSFSLVAEATELAASR